MMERPEFLNQLLARLPPDLAQQLASQRTEVLLAVLVGLVTWLLLLLWVMVAPKRRGGSVVVVAGPCGAGKTTLFYQLRDGSTHNGTVTSMQENSGVVGVKSAKGVLIGKVSIVDVPGHVRLRNKLDKYLSDAAAVLFVVDSVDITPNKVEAAEELFEVLTHASIARRRMPVFLACNKMDLETQAHSVDFVKRTLERQLDGMRKTRATLSREAADQAALLGSPDKPFSLAGLRTPIKAGSISAKAGDLADLHAFLAPYSR